MPAQPHIDADGAMKIVHRPRRGKKDQLPPEQPEPGAGLRVLTPEEEAAIGDDEEDDEDMEEDEPEDEPEEEDEATLDEPEPLPVDEPSLLAEPLPARRGRPPLRRPPARSGALPPRTNRETLVAQHAKLNKDLEEFLEDLDFDGTGHEIRLERLEPEFDVETGKQLKGHLANFSSKIGKEDVRARYGGGRYLAVVYGPNTPLDKRKVIKKRFTFLVSGDPIIPRAKSKDRDDRDLIEGPLQLVREIMTKSDQNANKLLEENRRTTTQLLQLHQNKGDANVPMLEMIREENRRRDEERRLEEARRADERRREDEQRREERDERRRLEGVAEQARREEKLEEHRRWEAEMKERDRKHEREMEQLRQDAKMAQDNVLRLSEKMEKDKMGNTQALMTMMAESNKTIFASMQQVDTMKMQFMDKALQSKPSGLDEIIKLKQAMDILNPDKGSDGPERWERIMDRAGEMVPGIVAAAGAWRMGQGQAQAPSARPGPAPGAMAVVDLGSQKRLGKGKRPMRGGTTAAVPPLPPMSKPQASVRGATTAAVPPLPPLPPQGTVQQAPVPQPQPAPTPQPVQVSPESVPAANPLKEFVFPTPDMPTEEVFKLLVADIDLAVQKNYTPGNAYMEIIQKFPPSVIGILKAYGADNLVDAVASNAPQNWAINSLQGSKLIEGLYVLMGGK